MHRIASLNILFLCICAGYLSADSIKIPELIKKNAQIFIESGTDNSRLSSEYVFIIPEGDYSLCRSVYPENRLTPSKTIVETIEQTNGKGTARYQIDRGFAFFRSSSDTTYYTYTSAESANQNIIEILNAEGNEREVHFYNYKNSWQFITALDLFYEGNIFSSKRENAVGQFFMRKLQPDYGTNRTCYLIYWDYISDYFTAKAEFERLFSCIYLISDGKLLEQKPKYAL